jgi:hypothetical protein
MRAPSSLQQARAKAVERFLAVADVLKAEAGVTEHIVRASLTGRALPSGKIKAPEGRSRKQLYILAHECAHIALRHSEARTPRHVQEMEAEKWAHAALRRHGVAVPRAMTELAKRYVQWKIEQAKRRGAKRIDKEAAAFARMPVRRPAARGAV